MTLSVSKKIHLTANEANQFNEWASGFFRRSENGEKNFARALRRKYGYPACRVTGSGNEFCLNLGYWT